MKKLFFISLLAMLTLTSSARNHSEFNNAKVVSDTIFYSENRIHVTNRADASYYRVLLSSMQGRTKLDLFCDYYLNGTLKAQGGYSFMDLANDQNTVLNGEITTYYSNGKEKTHGKYENGKRQGYFTTQLRDGSVAVLEYVNGESKHDYFTVARPDGNVEKRPISESKSLLQ